MEHEIIVGLNVEFSVNERAGCAFAICELIQSFIVNEPKNEPYSDQQIVYLLKQEGIDISRRTVAKYREQLNIPSSKKRVYF